MMSTLEIWLLVMVIIVSHVIVFALLLRKPKKSIVGRHVVVTGGSSGIGLWVAIHCVRQGANVTIIARNTALLGIIHSDIHTRTAILMILYGYRKSQSCHRKPSL